jgi:tRNA threonylcarbamoyladenosine biosynthesis protein TsaB
LALILNIETTTTNCSVSLSKEGGILVLQEDYNTKFTHAEFLHVFIEDVVRSSKIKLSDIDAIAVSKGPGSYTGLRIGVSAAKGLCFALNKPLISVPTLESLSHQVNIDIGVIVPMLDARRMEIYSAIFDAKHHQIRETQAQILDEGSFLEYLNKGKVYFIGNAVEKTKTIIQHENAFFIDNKLPSAKEMGKLAFDKYIENNFENVAYFEPFYLKDFINLS